MIRTTLTLIDPQVQVVPIETGKMLVFTDTESGNSYNIPMPDEVAAQIGDALNGKQQKSQVEVVPAAALQALRDAR